MTTKTLKFVFVALSLVAITCLASDSNSATEQYLTRHDQYHPFRPLDEALKALNSRHRFDLKQKKSQDEYPTNNNIVPDLQVGCGDGLLLETSTTARPPIPEYKKVYDRKDRRKRETGAREPRDFFVHRVYTPSSFSYSAWKPQPYKLERPYFVPVRGSHGRFPIYFPPQPVFENPGFPVDNPPRGLPPSTETSATEPIIEPEISDRFGEPVWDEVPMNPGYPTTSARPTTTSTFPPLIHNLNPESGSSPISTTPRPPSANYYPDVENNVRPEPAASVSVPVVTSAPSAPAATGCGFAIINCCSATSTTASEKCFESLGCPGPFWGTSPCHTDFAREAMKMALEYYQSRLQ